MKSLAELPVSILDLATIIQGDNSASEAFNRSLSFAQDAERLQYHRYWFAELSTRIPGNARNYLIVSNPFCMLLKNSAFPKD